MVRKASGPGGASTSSSGFNTSRGRAVIRSRAASHILANHAAGAGVPGKTEFPASWSDARILDAVREVTTHPRSSRADPTVRVAAKLTNRVEQVKTGFPLRGPGVRRNPLR